MHTILWTSYHYIKNSQFKHLTDLRLSQHSTQVPWPVCSFNLVLFSNPLCNTVSVTWDCTGWGKQKSLVCKYDFYMVFLTFYRIIKSHSTSAQNVYSRKVNLHAITSTWISAVTSISPSESTISSDASPMGREVEACGFDLTLLRFCPPLAGLRRAKKTPGQSPKGAFLLVHPTEWTLAHVLIRAMAVPLPGQLK